MATNDMHNGCTMYRVREFIKLRWLRQEADKDAMASFVGRWAVALDGGGVGGGSLFRTPASGAREAEGPEATVPMYL